MVFATVLKTKGCVSSYGEFLPNRFSGLGKGKNASFYFFHPFISHTYPIRAYKSIERSRPTLLQQPAWHPLIYFFLKKLLWI